MSKKRNKRESFPLLSNLGFDPEQLRSFDYFSFLSGGSTLFLFVMELILCAGESMILPMNAVILQTYVINGFQPQYSWLYL